MCGLLGSSVLYFFEEFTARKLGILGNLATDETEILGFFRRIILTSEKLEFVIFVETVSRKTQHAVRHDTLVFVHAPLAAGLSFYKLMEARIPVGEEIVWLSTPPHVGHFQKKNMHMVNTTPSWHD